MMGRGNTGPVYPWFGKDIRDGIPLAIENYALLRRLWREDVVDWKGKFRTVAGINPDYSYGRDNWAAFLAIMKKSGIEVQVVSELWPKLGATDFTAHVAALQQAKPDLIFSCFWAGDTPIFMKQAHAAGLTQSTKLVMTTGGTNVSRGIMAGSKRRNPPGPPK